MKNEQATPNEITEPANWVWISRQGHASKGITERSARCQRGQYGGTIREMRAGEQSNIPKQTKDILAECDALLEEPGDALLEDRGRDR